MDVQAQRRPKGRETGAGLQGITRVYTHADAQTQTINTNAHLCTHKRTHKLKHILPAQG